MPHLVIQYTPDLDAHTDMAALCRSLADALVAFRDAGGATPFPAGGTRVLAYPAAHSAVADGQHDIAFAYFNLRIATGRSPAVIREAGELLSALVRKHFEPVLAQRLVGLTVQIDEGHESFDAKIGNQHALYNKKVS